MAAPHQTGKFPGPGGLWKPKKKQNEAVVPEGPLRDGDKLDVEHVSNTSLDGPDASEPARRRREAPPLVRDLAPQERARLEKVLVKKIDLRLLPMLILMYLMNYLDRNNIAAARLAGLEEELELTGTQYLTCVSILFVGYILMQVPSNLFMNKIGKPSLYLPACMVVWGVISAATAAAETFGGLLAIRFFLGFVEAAYFPGCLFFLSSWYTRKELGFRTAILYSGSLMSGAFSGLITAGITGGMDGKRGLRAWRWLFIIEGIITIVIAFIAVFILPDFPRTTTWLTEHERQLAIWRLDEDIGEDDWTGSQNQTFWHGMKLAFQDVKMWNLVCISPFLTCSDGLGLCFPHTNPPPDGSAVLLRRLRHRHQPFPHHRRDPGLRQHPLSPLDCSTLRPRRHYHLPQLLACRPHRGEVFPHHSSSLYRRHRVHHCRRYHQDGAQVSGDAVNDTRCIHWLCGCIGLDQ